MRLAPSPARPSSSSQRRSRRPRRCPRSWRGGGKKSRCTGATGLPWGRAADAVEQLVIEEELRAADVRPPQYGIGGWIIQTITQYADADQMERWIRPSLEHTYTWCQLFSEPGAGSDAAGIRTKATK